MALEMTVFTALLTGMLVGAAHVFAGPDHLTAIAPLAVAGRRRSWATGLAWGAGHSMGVWGLAVLAWLLRDALPLDRLGSASEWLIGLLLVVVGLWGLRRLVSTRVHTHVHTHDGLEHAHIHVHETPIEPNHEAAHHTNHMHSALGIGTLHGLAGAAHLIGVLPAIGLPSAAAAMAYLISFGAGSIVAMSAFSWMMGALATRMEHRAQRAYRLLAGGSCTAAIGVGIWWLVAHS